MLRKHRVGLELVERLRGALFSPREFSTFDNAMSSRLCRPRGRYDEKKKGFEGKIKDSTSDLRQLAVQDDLEMVSYVWDDAKHDGKGRRLTSHIH